MGAPDAGSDPGRRSECRDDQHTFDAPDGDSRLTTPNKRKTVREHPPIRILLQLVAAGLAGLFAVDFSTWVYVRIYAFRQGVPLAELSNDYGMAFDALFIAVAAFLVTVPITYVLLDKIRFNSNH